MRAFEGSAGRRDRVGARPAALRTARRRGPARWARREADAATRRALPNAGFGKLTMNLEIMNSLYNVCGTLSGLHIDMMRRRERRPSCRTRPRSAGARRGGHGHARRVLALLEQGDVRPKIEIELPMIRVCEDEMSTDDYFTIELPDKRRWLFQVPTKRDLKRWHTRRIWRTAHEDAAASTDSA